MKEQAITNADDTKLIGLIDGAKRRVLYVAPGITAPVAKALIGAWKRIGTDSVQAIVDADPEIMRLGYGTLEGLKTLSDAERFLPGGLREHPGIRVGLLVADDAALVYSPTPLLVESEAADPSRPNAIFLDSVPTSVGAEVGLMGSQEQQVGLRPLPRGAVAEVERDLQAAPPARFDLARRVRAFTSSFQFVELEMTGCFVSRRKVPIPSPLVGLAHTKEVERQFHVHFDLVYEGHLEVKAPDGRMISEHSLREQRQKIVDVYLTPLHGYGTVILRSWKEKFMADIEGLKTDVATFSAGLTGPLQEQMNHSQRALVEALLPAVMHNPPAAYIKTTGPNPPEVLLRRKLEQDIAHAFGTAESLVDEQFLDVAKKAMPDVDCRAVGGFKPPASSRELSASGLVASVG